MRVSFVTPSTSCAISSPNSARTSSIVVPVSSTTSWSSAAAIVSSSRRSSARIFAAPHGWWMKSSPERRCWPSWASRREAERARQQLAVDVGVVRRDLREQLVDEVLMPLAYSRTAMYPVYSRVSRPPVLEPTGRNRGWSAKGTLSMLRRWRRSSAATPGCSASSMRERSRGRSPSRARASTRPLRRPPAAAAAASASSAPERSRLEQAAPRAVAVELQLREDRRAPRASTPLARAPLRGEPARAAPVALVARRRSRRTTSCGATVPFQRFSSSRKATS